MSSSSPSSSWSRSSVCRLPTSAGAPPESSLTRLLANIEAVTERSIPCIFQEPLFTDSDKEFLTGLGHTVVDAPEASSAVSNTSLLFGVHLYEPLYAEALKDSSPAVFVGTGLDVWDQ